MSGTVLITGASTGIGYELCHIYAKEKFRLIIVARNKAKLQEVADELKKKYSVTVDIFPLDLAKENAPEEMFAYTSKNNIEVDVLINNAGFGTNGEFLKSTPESEFDLVKVNVLSLLKLTKLYGQDMAKRKRGKILNVASTAAFQPGPYMSNYYASKAYVLSLTEGLSEEFKEHGLTISALCPGPTKTEFAERANMKATPLMNEGFFSFVMDAKSVALAGYKGLNKGKTIIIPGIINSLLVQSVRFSPRFIVRRIAAQLNHVRTNKK